ncbi:CS1-pili formation C-terminal domain-containing protein, partial [Vibrio parahaemolyticus]|nr:CS1-pili formation C-terminal domain-containing protein [Vibrio parahaemolyticus]
FRSSKNTKGVDFSYPGTLRIVDNTTKRIVSFMTYFENIEDQSINDIKCLGTGCVNVSRIGDGIYSISVIENDDYKIVSNGEYCLVNRADLQYYHGRSRCFPKVIEDDDTGLQLVKLETDSNFTRYAYLGKINKPIPEKLREQFERNGLKLIKYEFGKDNEFLFVGLPPNYKDNLELYVNNEIWSEIETYAISDYELEGYSYVY